MSTQQSEPAPDAIGARGAHPGLSLRAWGQSRSLPPATHATSASASSARPGSGGSLSGSGSVGGAESAGGGSGASQRSRSNSLGPCEVLTPVTEHGELGHEDLSLLPFLILSTNLSLWSNWYKDLATLPPWPSTLYERR
ncbi:hypothetical protein BC827DRAFT_1156039 [Russula dissimulans]|nr:hypothetical protein BC827DRAFT_1156039 [Russula dissimulans]